ncbi:MAG: aminotransferase class I/II-fold pyridoxal phosphate-dependent enzyme [Rikenellaceae bacterium]|nr:aminotransferase class I/II-fold pyridoxal phosphate-dependent enzyme [Rikenellaceae bacterium]
MTQIEIADRLGEVKEYYFSKKLAQVDAMRRAGHDVISLGIGSPDLPPHPSVVEALYKGAQDAHTHGYANYKGERVLLDAIAAWYRERYGVELDPETEILTLYGSKEGLAYLCQTFINRGDKVLVPNPGYPAYAAAVKLAGGIVDSYLLTEENGWMPDFEALEKSDLAGVKMMFLNYPHMPTGTAPAPGLFERFVDFARRHNILLVHDNPYSFIRNDAPQSLMAVPGAREVAIELNSLSKSQNMAGWRVGMMVGRADILAAVLRCKSNLNNAMFVPMQRAAAVALGLGDDWYESVNRIYRSREALAVKILETLGCKVRPGQMGLFEWGRLPESVLASGVDCYGFIDRILDEEHVFITPGWIFGSGGDKYVRVSLCADETTLQRALERLIK